MYEIKVSKRKNKKYDVYENGKYLLSFGAIGYAQYKDTTGIGAYSHLDHLNKDRRRLYYARHGRTNDKKSAKYYSNKFLWNEK
jgi:hypothetical protein